MNAVENACFKLCEEIILTSSDKDKTILNHYVKQQDNEKTVVVVLNTEEDEYQFSLILPEEVSCDNRVNQSSICTLKNTFKCIKIKGFDGFQFDRVDLQHLMVILEQLAEHHAKCLEENKAEKNNHNPSSYYVSEIRHETFVDILHSLLNEKTEATVDENVLMEGIDKVQETYQTLLKSPDRYAFVQESNLQETTNNCLHNRILVIKTWLKVPLVYDILMTIFRATDQDMRQHHFHDLLDYYYQNLEEKLQVLGLDIRKCLSLTAFQRQVHEFIPYVKLQMLKGFCQRFVNYKNSSRGKSNEQYKRIIWMSILELNECILNPNLSREDCYKILKSKIGTNDYNFLKYRLIHLEEREGFVGDYFKLKIEITRNGNNEMLHLFAKYLPFYSELAIDSADQTFKKEEFYYLRLIPEMNDFGLEDITDFLPRCYYSRSNEVLIFEDMFKMDFRTIPVSEAYNYEMLSITVKQLAKLHACSLLYEEFSSAQCKETIRFDTKFPEYIEEKNVLITGGSLISKCFQCSQRVVLDMLNVFPEIPKKFSMEVFKEKAKFLLDLCFEKVKKSDKYRNVMCQGDVWSSNIFFKIGKDMLPIDCKLVDYQLIRYCPPPQDIFFLLYMTTTREMRKKFESQLLQEYYTELSSILQKYRVDLQTIYTYQQFADCCDYMRSQGLCQALMVLQFVLFPKEKLSRFLQDKELCDRLFFDNRDVLIEELQYKGIYAQRMRDLVEDLYEFCEKDLM